MTTRESASDAGPRKPRIGEVWVNCAYAREVWDKLKEGGPERGALRMTLGSGPDARIRGGKAKVAYAKVLECNVRKWAEIAGADPGKLILSTPPDRPPDSETTPEADEYLRACAERIAVALARSRPLALHLCQGLTGRSTPAQLAGCAEDLSDLLMDMPRDTLERLWKARQRFETPPQVDPQALASIKAIVREMALLIYDLEEIEGVRQTLEAGGAAAVMVPAASATAAEIIMARLDRRQAAFEKAGDNEWPHGQVAIPLPPETGRDFLSRFGPAIDRHVYEVTLSSTERALKDEGLKLRLARIALDKRNEALYGRFYCILNLEIAEPDRIAWSAHVAQMAGRWPQIRFVDLKTDDPERYILEKTLLWALKDFLYDD